MINLNRETPMRLNADKSPKPLTKFKKIFSLYLLFTGLIFLLALSSGFFIALSASLTLLGLFGIGAALFKKSATKDRRQGAAIVGTLLFIVGFAVLPSPDSSVITNIFLSIFLLSLVALLAGLIKPSLFSFGGSKALGRLKLSYIFGALFLIASFGLGLTSEPEITSINLVKQQDVLSDKYTIEGKFVGNPSIIAVNGEALDLEGTEFSKEVSLDEGDNEIIVVMKKDDRTLYNEKFYIYYDYEGRIYSELLKEEKREAEEIKKKLARVPAYEIVRKESMPNGFSAIVYLDARPEDYLVSNIIKHIKYYHSSTEAISLLVFEKSDKLEVEKILDSTNVSGLSTKIRANYEKRSDKEELFLFPEGLEAAKLALEV